MGYFLAKNCRAVLYDSEIVFLNLLSNKYQALDKKSTEELCNLLSLADNKNVVVSKKQGSVLTQKLVNSGLIDKNELNLPLIKGGLKDYSWVLQKNYVPFSQISKIEFLKCMQELIRVHYIIKKRGILGVINLLQQESLSSKVKRIPTDEELTNLMGTLEYVCRYYHKKVVCLAWAACFTMLGLRKSWDIKFALGVQLHPFLAHAWVEREGKVVGDREDVNQYLGVLLREPSINFDQ